MFLLLYSILIIGSQAISAFRIDEIGTISRNPQVYENILRPAYGVNFKFNGVLHHNLDRVWVVTKVPVPEVLDTSELDVYGNKVINETEVFNCTKWAEDISGCEPCMQMGIRLHSVCESAHAEWVRIKTWNQAILKEVEERIEDVRNALPELYKASQRSGPDQGRTKRQAGTGRTKTEEETSPKSPQEDTKMSPDEDRSPKNPTDERSPEYENTEDTMERVSNIRVKFPPRYKEAIAFTYKDNKNRTKWISGVITMRSEDTFHFKESRFTAEGHRIEGLVRISETAEVTFHEFGNHTLAKRGIFTAVLGGLITVASETVNYFLAKKRNKAIEKAGRKLEEETNKILNSLRQVRGSQIMYGEYTIENLESVYDAIDEQQKDMKRAYDNLANTFQDFYWKSIQAVRNDRKKEMIQHEESIRRRYRTLVELARDKYIYRVKDVLKELESLLAAIETLAHGRLPHQIITHTRIKEMIKAVEEVLIKDYHSYRVALDSTDQYFDMKLATFAVNPETDAMYITFPIFIRPTTLEPFSLYEIETVPVPIEDQDESINSYTEVIMAKPYIANNKAYYIQLRIPELRMCKIIDHMYFCEEIFLMKHQTKHSCESAILNDLPRDFIKQNCDFKYYYNKTVVPAVLDGGDTIVLANFDAKKRLNCFQNHNLDTPMTLEHHPYQVINRSVLCNCKIEADMISVLQSASACEETNKGIPPLLFTANKGFNMFLEEFTKTAQETGYLKELQTDIDKGYITAMEMAAEEEKHILPLQMPDIRDPTTNERPETMKKMLDSLNRLKQHQREVAAQDVPLEKFQLDDDFKVLNSTPIALFEFITSLIVFCIIGWIIYKWCRKYKTLAPAIGYTYTKGAEAAGNFTTGPGNDLRQTMANCTIIASKLTVDRRENATANDSFLGANTFACSAGAMSYVIVLISILTVVIWIFKRLKQMKWLKGELLEDTCEVQIWIWSGVRYAPVPVMKLPGHCTLFSRQGYLDKLDINLQKRWIHDYLHLNWENCMVYYKGSELELPSTVRVPLKDKIRIRKLTGATHYRINVMLKSGKNWYQLPQAIGPRLNWQTPTPNSTESDSEEETPSTSQSSKHSQTTPRTPLKRKIIFSPPTNLPHTAQRTLDRTMNSARNSFRDTTGAIGQALDAGSQMIQGNIYRTTTTDINNNETEETEQTKCPLPPKRPLKRGPDSRKTQNNGPEYDRPDQDESYC